jgi:uncharacterized protein YkwD
MIDRRSLITIAVVVAGVAAVLLIPGDEPDKARSDAPTHGCAGAREEPGVDLDAARDATLCLVNAVRRARGLRPLRRHSALERAAYRHSRDMVRREFFEHVNPDGVDAHTRIIEAGYGPEGSRATTGENLATGENEAAAPAVIVDGWLHSPGHRRILLRAGFTDIGIGIAARAVGEKEESGATYTAAFGEINAP